jgi:hypothetical protein
MSEGGGGCLGIMILTILLWGAIAYIVARPPPLEDVPWIVAGVFSVLILINYIGGR